MIFTYISYFLRFFCMKMNEDSLNNESLHHEVRLIVAFLFFNYFGESMYDPPRFTLILSSF